MKRKSIISILLCASMLLSLTACGDKNETETSTSVSYETSVSEEVSTEVTESVSEVTESVEETPALRETDSDLSQAKIRDVVCFGEYYIESEDYTSPMEWYVIDKDEEAGTVWLLSKYIIDTLRFSYEYGQYCEWSYSDVRSFLMNDFYETAFNETEQHAIKETDHMCYDAYTGYATNSLVDKVFLLSEKEAQENVIYAPLADGSENLSGDFEMSVAELSPLVKHYFDTRDDMYADRIFVCYKTDENGNWVQATEASDDDYYLNQADYAEYNVVVESTYWYTRDVCEYYVGGLSGIDVEKGTGIPFDTDGGIRPSIVVKY